MRGALVALALAACSGPDLGAARFSAEECRRVFMSDAATGEKVTGAEDIDVSETKIWVSAYDRITGAQGGVYRAPLEKLKEEALQLHPFLIGVRPHGIEASENSVTAILRDDEGGASIVRAHSVQGRLLTGSPTEVPCGANDLVTGWEITAYTVDPAICDRGWRQRLRTKPSGRVEKIVGVGRIRSVMKEGLHLANGIAEADDRLWVAEMRARRLTRIPDGRIIGLPGAPDNLNASEEGILAALQPSLWRFGLYRYGYIGRAPSRIVLVDPETEGIELLFEDPSGALLSGATAAVLQGGRLIASSVRGSHLLLCETTP